MNVLDYHDNSIEQNYKRRIYSSELDRLFKDNNFVYKCCNIVARKISRQKLRIRIRTNKNGEETFEYKNLHPVLDILNKPNHLETYHPFMYRYACSLTLKGNAIAYRMAETKRLFVVNPTYVVPQFVGMDLRYTIAWAQNDYGLSSKTIEFGSEEIAHARLPDPDCIYWGLSPFLSTSKELMFDTFAKHYLLDFFDQKPTSSDIFTYEDTIKEDTIKLFEKKIKTQYQGRNKGRKPLHLPQGVSYKEAEQKISDPQLTEHIQSNKNDIISLLSIPPHEFGLQANGSIGSNESKEQIKNFWISTIIPFQDLIADSLNSVFQDSLADSERIEFDNSNIECLREDAEKKAKVAEAMVKSTHTVNEVRRKLYGDDELIDGDRTPGTVRNDFLSSQTPKKLNTVKKDIFSDKNSDWLKKRRDLEKRLEEAGTRKLEEVTTSIFTRAFQESLLTIRVLLPNLNQKDENSDWYRSIKNSIESNYGKYETEWVDGTVPTLQSIADIGYDMQLNLPFNIPNRAEIEALKVQNLEGRNAQLAARQIVTFQGLTETQTNQIMGSIASELEKSRSIDEISRNIADQYFERVPNRARVIARTEVLTATSLGQKSAEDDMIDVLGKEKMVKRWLTADDERVRDTHQALNDLEIGIEDVFPNGLRFPRDPKGPASETIQCRCTWITYPKNEEF